jgi:hypothetical protein
MEDGGWRMEDGRWRMEDGGWRMEDGGWKMENRGWKMKIEYGGGPDFGNSEQRIENRELGTAISSPGTSAYCLSASQHKFGGQCCRLPGRYTGGQ